MLARALAALALAVPFAACGGDGLDRAGLEKALRARTEARLADAPDMKGVTVEAVRCVEGSRGREFRCSGRLSNGLSYAGLVTVGADGKTFVSEMD